MDGIERVRTARLVATRPVFRDADELHPVMADERLAAWLWPGELGGPRSAAQVRAMLVRDADHWKRHGWGPWVVRDATTGEALGRVGLERCEIGGRDEVEVAWLIAAHRWGEGLATEIAQAAVRAAFDVVGLSDVVSFTLTDNTASRRVMEKLGFAYERDVEHAGLPHVLYRLSGARRASLG
jgi:ribosomal-protein-alanine N-acetyltransferase